MKLLKKLLLPTLVLIVLTPIMTTAQQDANIGLTVQPAIFELAAQPGSTISTNIKIENISDGPVGIELNTQSLLPNDPTIDQEKRKDADASTWLLNKNEKHVLSQGELKEIPVQFIVPEDASPGTHDTLVTFTATNPAEISDATGAVVTPVLTSLALITVAGDIVEEASIGDLHLPFLIFGQQHELNFDISNTGNVHILPTATVRLYDHSGQLVENIGVPPQLILPNTIKSFMAEWSSDGRIGPHSIEVEVSYGTPTQYSTISSGTVILMPNLANTIFGLSMILALIAALLFFFRGPLSRGIRYLMDTSYRFRIRNKDRDDESNKPENLARISMDSAKIDEILSSNYRARHSRPQPPAQPKSSKKKKIIIK